MLFDSTDMVEGKFRFLVNTIKGGLNQCTNWDLPFYIRHFRIKIQLLDKNLFFNISF